MIYGVMLFSAVSSVHERTFRSTRKSPKIVMPHLVIIYVFPDVIIRKLFLKRVINNA